MSGEVQKMIVDTFKKFDANGDGMISRDELKRVLNAISSADKFDDGAVDALLAASDTNKDGFISYQEFVAWVTKDAGDKSAGDMAPIDKRGGLAVDFRKFMPERFTDITKRFDVDKGEIGAGGFGSVFIAKDKNFSNRQVAVKRVEIKRDKKAEELADLDREIAVMKDLDHPNICKLLATFRQENSLYFVMELCEGGEVFDRIIETGYISERTCSTIVAQICSALSHAHSRGIAHRDIKPENVVFCSKEKDDLRVKLIDWGLATSIGDGMTKAVGSMTYAAPEVISSQDRKQYTEACDLWSTGVMTYVMLCGKPPFWGTREQHFRAAKNERYPFKDPPWDRMNPKAKDFVARLLKAKPSQRMCVKDACQHEWLKEAQAKEDTASDAQSASVLGNLKCFCAQSTFKRMCITAVARQLDHKHLKDIHQVFRDMDKDGNGVLSYEEVADGLGKMLGEADKAQLKKIFDNLDLDGSKSIDYTEFCAAGLDVKMSSQEEAMWAAFKVFDTENKGMISIANLQKLLNSADIKDSWSPDVCKEVGAEIIARFDTDGDGMIDFENWKELMQQCWSKNNTAPASGAASAGAGSIGAYDILSQVNALDVKAIPTE